MLEEDEEEEEGCWMVELKTEMDGSFYTYPRQSLSPALTVKSAGSDHEMTAARAMLGSLCNDCPYPHREGISWTSARIRARMQAHLRAYIFCIPSARFLHGFLLCQPPADDPTSCCSTSISPLGRPDS